MKWLIPIERSIKLFPEKPRWFPAGFAVFALFFSVFQFNFLETADAFFFGVHQTDSERTVILAMLNAEAGLPRRALGLYHDDKITVPAAYVAFRTKRPLTTDLSYKSQLGLQGHFFSLLHKVVNSRNLSSYQTINSLLLAAVLSLLAAGLAKEFGWLSGIGFCAAVVLSPWLVTVARNLFWAAWTWFLPALIVAYYSARAGRFEEWGAHQAKMLALLFIAILLKSLCGYDYLSTIVVTAFVPAVYFAIKNRRPSGDILRTVLAIGMTAVAAFLLALLLHAWARGDGLIEGFRGITADVQRRTYAFGADSLATQGVPPETTLASVILPYVFDWPPHAPALARIGMPVVVLVLGLVILAVAMRRRMYGLATGVGFAFLLTALLRAPFSFLMIAFLASAALLARRSESKAQALGFAFLVSILAPLSWCVLAKAHSFHHQHMNFVLWDVPTIYLGVVSIAYLFLLCAEEASRRNLTDGETAPAV
jgi:hypothetical protein